MKNNVMKYASVILPIIGFVFAIYWVVANERPKVVAAAVNEPAATPFTKTIAGSGIIESANENVNVAPAISGQVVKVFVKQGAQVKRGAPLYQIDPRQQAAAVNEAAAQMDKQAATIETARAEVMNQQAALKSAEANVNALQATYEDAEQITKRNEVLGREGVISEQLKLTSLKAAEAARGRLEQAKAQLAQVKAQNATAAARLREAEAALAALRAQKQQLNVGLEKLTVTAPRDGRVLQVNIREGEFVSSTPQIAPILFGDTEYMQVRVDIDEINASRVPPGAPAVALLKGNAKRRMDLEFVRIEPYIVPKKSLTGDNSERVDVRVLQVVYRFRPPQFPVYVGQQVDVFLDGTAAN
jgi:multidrug resistance efflux pump